MLGDEEALREDRGATSIAVTRHRQRTPLSVS